MGVASGALRPPIAWQRARRWAHDAVLALLAVGGLVMTAILLMFVLGNRPLIVMSGSMAPAIEAGDIVISQIVAPDKVQVGEVVTFKDHSRDGDLVTHRVIEATKQGTKFAFVTKGDVNGATETWMIDEQGSLGSVYLRVKGIGRYLLWGDFPEIRVALIVAASFIIALNALRWIWRPRGGLV